jgi:hypothetical protein
MRKNIAVYAFGSNPAVSAPRYHCSRAWADGLVRDGATRLSPVSVMLASRLPGREIDRGHLRTDDNLPSRRTPAAISASESQLNAEYSGPTEFARMARKYDAIVDSAIADHRPIPRAAYQTLAAAKVAGQPYVRDDHAVTVSGHVISGAVEMSRAQLEALPVFGS